MFPPDPARILILLAGVITVSVGFAVLLSKVQRRPHRAFGTILILKGLVLVTGSYLTSGSPQLERAMLTMQPYLLLPILPLMWYAASIFPQRRGAFRRAGSGWWVVAIIFLLEFAYFFKHELVYGLEPASASGAGLASSQWAYASFGPLLFFFAPVGLGFSLLGLWYARMYQKADGRIERSVAVIASGLVLNGIFDGGVATGLLLHDPTLGQLRSLGWLFPVTGALALVPACIGLGMMITARREAAQPDVYVQYALPAMAVLAFMSGPIPIALGATGYGLVWQSALVLALWRLVMPLTVGYALIRSGMLEHVRLPHLWPRGSKATPRPAAARSSED